MRLLESILRKLIFNLMVMLIIVFFIIKSLGVISMDIISIKSGADTFKQITNYSDNINNVFEQVENLGE